MRQHSSPDEPRRALSYTNLPNALEIIRAASQLARARGQDLVGFEAADAPTKSTVPSRPPGWRALRSYSIAVPRTLNDGRVVSARTLAELLLAAADRFGGVTAREASGLCLDENVLEADVLLDLEIWTSDEMDLLEYARDIAVRLDQRVVAVRMVGQRIVLVGQERQPPRPGLATVLIASGLAVLGLFAAMQALLAVGP